MPLSFQPACLPVAHGCLPHTIPSESLSLLLHTTPDILAWPFLPQRGFREQPYVQSALGFPGLVMEPEAEQMYVDQMQAQPGLDQLALAYLQNAYSFSASDPDEVVGLSALRRNLGSGYSALALKSQIVGPISLGLQLTDEQHHPLLYTPMLMESLAQHLALRVAWQCRMLSGMAANVILCLDEPFLEAFDMELLPVDWEQAAEWLEQVLAGVQGCRGLAISGAVNWMNILDTTVELIHCDAYESAEGLLEAEEYLIEFLKRPGTIMWGLVPTDEDDLTQATATTLIDHFELLLDELAHIGLTREDVVQQSLISTNGGLAHMSAQAAEHAMTLCQDVSTELRTRYKLA